MSTMYQSEYGLPMPGCNLKATRIVNPQDGHTTQIVHHCSACRLILLHFAGHLQLVQKSRSMICFLAGPSTWFWAQLIGAIICHFDIPTLFLCSNKACFLTICLHLMKSICTLRGFVEVIKLLVCSDAYVHHCTWLTLILHCAAQLRSSICRPLQQQLSRTRLWSRQ